ncbi:hypothetical protein M1146_02820 [Patescibacteria group bacterium]|nr:hypothetical protein [Patescibacteria group bacterium]
MSEAKIFSRFNDASCEAKITTRTLKEPVNRIVYDLDDRRHDLGPGVVDAPGEVEATAICDLENCQLREVFTAEGNGPYGALNAARRAAGVFITENCSKWKAEVEKGYVEGKMPLDKVPGNI